MEVIIMYLASRNLIALVVVLAIFLWTSLRFPEIYKLLMVYRFYGMALFHSETRRHVIFH